MKRGINVAAEEEEVEELMNRHFNEEGLEADCFGVSVDTFMSIRSIGVATLISIYCEGGQKFDAKNFKEQLKEITGAGPDNRQALIDVHKIYNFLNDIRRKVCKEETCKKRFSTPGGASTSSSISSSSSSYEIRLLTQEENNNSDNEGIGGKDGTDEA